MSCPPSDPPARDPAVHPATSRTAGTPTRAGGLLSGPYRRKYNPYPTPEQEAAWMDRLAYFTAQNDVVISIAELTAGMRPLISPEFRGIKAEATRDVIAQYGVAQARRIHRCPGCTLVFAGGGSITGSPGAYRACAACRRPVEGVP